MAGPSLCCLQSTSLAAEWGLWAGGLMKKCTLGGEAAYPRAWLGRVPVLQIPHLFFLATTSLGYPVPRTEHL